MVSENIQWKIKKNSDYIYMYYIVKKKKSKDQNRKIEKMRGKTMSKLKKRELERKGVKKQMIQDNKIMDKHLEDSTNMNNELEELSED